MFKRLAIGFLGLFPAPQRLQRDALIVMRERTRGIELERPPGEIDDILIAAEFDQRGTQAMQQLAVSGVSLSAAWSALDSS